MMQEISDALINGLDSKLWTCIFPDVLDNLTGSDANYEMVTSSTLARLRLVWSSATKLRVYIFYHSELQGFSVWTGTQDAWYEGERFTAQIMSEKAKEAFIATKLCLEEDVKTLADYTKEQIIEEVHEIKSQVYQITAADGPCVGIFMVHIGFSVHDKNKKVKEHLDIKIDWDDRLALTHAGEGV